MPVGTSIALSTLMTTSGPQNGQYHKYTPPDVVPIATRPAPVTSFLDSLRNVGVPESVLDQARTALGSLGLTDTTINEMREVVSDRTRRTVDWSRRNPEKAAGGAAAIALLAGLLLFLAVRRR